LFTGRAWKGAGGKLRGPGVVIAVLL